MGQTKSVYESQASQKSTNSLIKQKLKEKEASYERTRTIKLLLYGTGESGKTTILRQMRMSHGDDMLSERKLRRGLICLNIIEGAYNTLRAAKMKYNVSFNHGDAAKCAGIVEKYFKHYGRDAAETNLDSLELVRAILTLYDDADFRSVLAKRYEFQLPDGWIYYAEKLKKFYPDFGGPGWTPTEEDLLHSRIRTTGRNSFNFQLDGIQYQLIDVGGQQSERRKFFHIFHDMDAVLYVASLSEYNQGLFEDESTNRLTESVRVWERTVNNSDFANTWFLFFFNKFDLFQDKFYYDKLPIQLHFKYKPLPPKPEDEKDAACEKALEWFHGLYMNQVNEAKRKQVRMYVTTALDQSSVTRAMQLCTSLFLNQTDIGSYV